MVMLRGKTGNWKNSSYPRKRHQRSKVSRRVRPRYSFEVLDWVTGLSDDRRKKPTGSKGLPRRQPSLHEKRKKRKRRNPDSCDRSLSSDISNHVPSPRGRPKKNDTGSVNSTLTNASTVNEPIYTPNEINPTKALMKEKSFIQVINNYIKAGIKEATQQAEKYIIRAIDFGLSAGYLRQRDSSGKQYELSSSLMARRQEDVEARETRRRVRRGEEKSSDVDRKALRRGILIQPSKIKTKPKDPEKDIQKKKKTTNNKRPTPRTNRSPYRENKSKKRKRQGSTTHSDRSRSKKTKLKNTQDSLRHTPMEYDRDDEDDDKNDGSEETCDCKKNRSANNDYRTVENLDPKGNSVQIENDQPGGSSTQEISDPSPSTQSTSQKMKSKRSIKGSIIDSDKNDDNKSENGTEESQKHD